MKYLFLALSLLISAYSQAITTTQIKELIAQTHRTGTFHGNLLIKQNGQTLYKEGQGLANREWEVPHTIDSKFMIASLTKQFTAYAILNLVKENKLKLEDSISKFINLPRNSTVSQTEWDAITIHHLLSHTSGITRDVKRTENMSTSDYNLIGTIINHVLAGKKIIFKAPGEYHYSNLGYLLLAEVIEKASNSFYINYLKRIIFTPLEMNNTGEYHRRKAIPKMVEGYFRDDSRRTNRRCCHDASIFTGSHGLFSTVEDLDIWNRELNGETNILNQDIFRLMKSEKVTIDESSSYGYGLNIDKIKGLNRIWHTGHEWGYASLMTYIPELKLSIIYLSNYHTQDVFSFNPNHVKLQNELIDLLSQQI